MAKVIEVPGVGNVEFPDDMGDAEISHAIQTRILPQQQAQAEQPNQTADMTSAMAIPAAAAAIPATARLAAVAPEAYQTAKTIATPAVSGAWNLAKAYATNPKTLMVDALAAHMGLNPPTAQEHAIKGISDTYSQVQDYLKKQGQFAAQGTTQVNPTTVAANQAMNARNNQIVSAIQEYIAQHPDQANEFLPHAGNFDKLAEVAQTKGISIPGVTAETAAPAESMAARLGSRIAPIAQKMAPYLNAVVNNPVTRFAASTPVQGALLMSHSGDLNTGEDAMIRQIHAQQDQQRQIDQAIRNKAAQKALAPTGGPVAPGQ